jgi:hypothetical protein
MAVPSSRDNNEFFGGGRVKASCLCASTLKAKEHVYNGKARFKAGVSLFASLSTFMPLPWSSGTLNCPPSHS